MAHNLIWFLLYGVDPATRHPLTIDHIDRNGSNNEPSNLRLATKQQQRENQSPIKGHGTSKYKGVAWHKDRSKWQAYWQHPVTRKLIYLGLFTDERKAFNKCVQARFLDYAARKRED